jgi:hypothetical protein
MNGRRDEDLNIWIAYADLFLGLLVVTAALLALYGVPPTLADLVKQVGPETAEKRLREGLQAPPAQVSPAPPTPAPPAPPPPTPECPGCRSRALPSCEEKENSPHLLFKLVIVGSDSYEAEARVLSMKGIKQRFAKDIEEAKQAECRHRVGIAISRELTGVDYDTALRRLKRDFYVEHLGVRD